MNGKLDVKIFNKESDITVFKEKILGIVEYGKKQKGKNLIVGKSIPYQFIKVENTSQSSYEVWYTDENVNYNNEGYCNVAESNSYCFLTATVKESKNYQAESEMAYKKLFSFLDMKKYCGIRFWNYISDINSIGNSEEKYKEFCRGREKAFLNYYTKVAKDYPAATGIGCKGNDICISLLAVNKEMRIRNIENPRQIPAYQYPKAYGVSTPKFSRATYISNNTAKYIFVSGTASIIAADTVYSDDVKMQTLTTIENIFVLLSAENLKLYNINGISIEKNLKLIKVYIRDWNDYVIVKKLCEKKFGQVEALYFQNDICRKDLLVEIEAVVSTI